MKKLAKKVVADTLRACARDQERGLKIVFPNGITSNRLFTCHRVYAALGQEYEDRYAETFGFSDEPTDNAADLWASPDNHDIRVLLLCFAAAMAETGDL